MQLSSMGTQLKPQFWGAPFPETCLRHSGFVKVWFGHSLKEDGINYKSPSPPPLRKLKSRTHPIPYIPQNNQVLRLFGGMETLPISGSEVGYFISHTTAYLYIIQGKWLKGCLNESVSMMWKLCQEAIYNKYTIHNN